MSGRETDPCSLVDRCWHLAVGATEQAKRLNATVIIAEARAEERRACAGELREMAADILARHEMNEHVARVMRQAADRIERKQD